MLKTYLNRLASATSAMGHGSLTALFLALSFSTTALAQTPITGSYGPYSVTLLKAGIVPAPGTVVLENGSMFYDTSDFVDSSGNKTETPKTSAFVNRTTIGYVISDFQLFGADFYPAVFIILSDQLVRPIPGSQRELQLGDLVVQPVALGWHADEWHAQFNYNLWLPTGRFEAGASNNTGKGMYSHMLTGGVTWLQKAPLPWIATAQLRYELFGKQETTDIRPGQVMTIEFSIGKEIFKSFDLGISGATSFQTTTESGSAPGTDTSHYRYSGIGPEFHWRPNTLPGSQVSVRTFFEFGARNTSEGVGALLSLSYAF